MKQFEYKVVEIYDTDAYMLTKKLKEWGDNGWELITIRNNYTYIFKREIIDNKKEEGL